MLLNSTCNHRLLIFLHWSSPYKYMYMYLKIQTLVTPSERLTQLHNQIHRYRAWGEGRGTEDQWTCDKWRHGQDDLYKWGALWNAVHGKYMYRQPANNERYLLKHRPLCNRGFEGHSWMHWVSGGDWLVHTLTHIHTHTTNTHPHITNTKQHLALI